MAGRSCSSHPPGRDLTNAKIGTAKPFSWGKKWGKKPHRSQPIPADLDLAKTA
jgi:hypothetical protein